VILFLQTWRAAVIPLIAIPVSLIGTFLFKPQIAHVEPSAVVRRLISGEANSR